MNDNDPYCGRCDGRHRGPCAVESIASPKIDTLAGVVDGIDKSGRVLQKITINNKTGQIEFGPFCPEGFAPDWTLETAMKAAEPMFHRGWTLRTEGRLWIFGNVGYADTALGALLLAINPKESPK